MQMTPEMIDAAVMQLKMLFENSETIPGKVRDKGKEFIDALDEWSESMKKEQASISAR